MGDSLARKVFVFVSNMGSNWTNTIEGRVDLAGLSNVLPVGAAEMLAPHDLGQGLRAWGTKPTAVARISKMNPGDVAFAIRKDRVYLAAEVAWVAREPQPLLARALWGSPDYSYVFFMCNPIIHYRPVGEFLKDMGELGSYVMGFRSSDKAARRLERFGDAREFMEYALRVPNRVVTPLAPRSAKVKTVRTPSTATDTRKSRRPSVRPPQSLHRRGP